MSGRRAPLPRGAAVGPVATRPSLAGWPPGRSGRVAKAPIAQDDATDRDACSPAQGGPSPVEGVGRAGRAGVHMAEPEWRLVWSLGRGDEGGVYDCLACLTGGGVSGCGPGRGHPQRRLLCDRHHRRHYDAALDHVWSRLASESGCWHRDRLGHLVRPPSRVAGSAGRGRHWDRLEPFLARGPLRAQHIRRSLWLAPIRWLLPPGGLGGGYGNWRPCGSTRRRRLEACFARRAGRASVTDDPPRALPPTERRKQRQGIPVPEGVALGQRVGPPHHEGRVRRMPNGLQQVPHGRALGHLDVALRFPPGPEHDMHAHRKAANTPFIWALRPGGMRPWDLAGDAGAGPLAEVA